MGDAGGSLPPGFRFYPTDEELVVHFLRRHPSCHPDLIPDLHLFPYDPWDLLGKAFSQDRKCYFYSRRTQTHITQSGHWRPTGLDHPIFSNARKVGFKKSFLFYTGHPASDQPSWPTNWIMHEYRLISDASTGTTSSTKSRPKSDHSRWVICKVYEQTAEDDDANNHNNNSNETELSCLDEVFLSMDDYDEISFPS